jgi:hypothetical protein
MENGEIDLLAFTILEFTNVATGFLQLAMLATNSTKTFYIWKVEEKNNLGAMKIDELDYVPNWRRFIIKYWTNFDFSI